MAGHFVLSFTNVAIVATNMRCVDSKIFLIFPPGHNAKSTLYLRLLLSFYTPFRPALNIYKMFIARFSSGFKFNHSQLQTKVPEDITKEENFLILLAFQGCS